MIIGCANGLCLSLKTSSYSEYLCMQKRLPCLTTHICAGGTILPPVQLSAVLYNVDAGRLLSDERYHSASHCANGGLHSLSISMRETLRNHGGLDAADLPYLFCMDTQPAQHHTCQNIVTSMSVSTWVCPVGHV